MSSPREIYLHCRMINAAPFNMYTKAGYSIIKTDYILILLTLQGPKHLMRKQLLVSNSSSKMDVSNSNENQPFMSSYAEIVEYFSRYRRLLPRDQKERPPCIPQDVLEAKAKEAADKEKRRLERDMENENEGAGVYSASLKKHYILANDDWKEDIMPEILDGHHVYDFVDPDILLTLEELKRVEGLRQEDDEEEDLEMDEKELTPKEQEALAEIRKKKSLLLLLLLLLLLIIINT